MPPVVPFSSIVRQTVDRYSMLVWIAGLLVALGFLSSWILADGLRRQKESAVEEDPANYPQALSDGRPATVYFFHVDWCSFCTKAQPVWRRFTQAFDGREVNGFRVSCIAVNVTDPKNKERGVDPALAQQYRLESYPTVKIVLEGKKVVLLNSSVTDDALRSFVRDCTKNGSRGGKVGDDTK